MVEREVNHDGNCKGFLSKENLLKGYQELYRGPRLVQEKCPCSWSFGFW